MAASIKQLLILLCIFNVYSAFIGGDTYKRTLSVELNPGWNTSVSPAPPGVSLLHVRAQGDNDTLHFLLCSLAAPTLLLVQTNNAASSVQVNWTSFLAQNTSGSLRVEPKSSILHSTALVFATLWEYDDVNDTVSPDQLPPSSFQAPYRLQDFSWTLQENGSSLDPQAPTLRFCGGTPSPSFDNGSVCLQFSAFNSGGRDQAWPGLLHSANSSQVKVWLEGVANRTNHSRFSLELQAVGDAHPLDTVAILKSIDDEYTPSVFKVSQWVESNSSSPEGFVQWKPVAYRKPRPASYEDATPCSHSAPVPVTQAATPSGLVQAFYGATPTTTALNISFGIQGDPLYAATKYLSWTVLVGVGRPPVESFSPLILAIMAVGLGTPMLIILVGGVYVCFRKKPLPPAYQPIN